MRKAGRILLALLLGLVGAELLLRAAGWAYLTVHRRGPSAEAGEGAILCVGDSNTFGLYLAPADSYPARLGELVATAGADAPAVLNLGVPGMGADHVARNLPEQIERHRPGVVIALFGVNNTWSQTGWRDSGLGRFVGDLRIVKCFLLLSARDDLSASREADSAGAGETAEGDFRTTDDAMGLIDYRRSAEDTGDGRVFRIENRAGEKVTFHQPRKRLEGGDFLAAIENRCDELFARCDEAGVAPMLLTYPFALGPIPDINRTLRGVAARTGVLFVDLEEVLAPYVAELGIEELAFPDGHPRALATEVMAAAVHRALHGAGLVAGEAAALPLAADLAARSDARERTLALDGQRLVITGRHGDAARVLFSDAQGAEEVAGFATGLAASDHLRQSLRQAAYLLPIGPEGRVELPLPPKLRRAAKEGPLYAQALFGPQHHPDLFRSASAVVTIAAGATPPAGDPPR
ncbi:MAG: GDSL-type esterase/lipase family protein [Planctomycetota bacterium]